MSRRRAEEIAREVMSDFTTSWAGVSERVLIAMERYGTEREEAARKEERAACVLLIREHHVHLNWREAENLIALIEARDERRHPQGEVAR
jgi:hypothetical protein